MKKERTNFRLLLAAGTSGSLNISMLQHSLAVCEFPICSCFYSIFVWRWLRDQIMLINV